MGTVNQRTLSTMAMRSNKQLEKRSCAVRDQSGILPTGSYDNPCFRDICSICNRSHGHSELADGPEPQIRRFLSQIEGLDHARVQRATTKCELIDILHDPHTQCLRVWGTARLP